MRKKSIHNNKKNRKKTNRKKTYHKKTYRKKINRKNKSSRGNIQRGGSGQDQDYLDDELNKTEEQLSLASEFSQSLLNQAEELVKENEELDKKNAELVEENLKLRGETEGSEPCEVLKEEMGEKEEQLRQAAEFGQTLLEKTEELQEELDAMLVEKEATIAEAEEAEYRAKEAQESLEKLIEARGEELDTAVSNARKEGERSGYGAEKSRNEGRLKEILENVNELGSVTEGESYSPKSDTEDIGPTLENMVGVIEEKIKQQIKLGTAAAEQSLMEAKMGQATLEERIEELGKEVDEARATRDKANLKKEIALKSLKEEEFKNSELIARNQEVVSGHVADKKVLRQQNENYESQNKVYRENNTELKAKNEKLYIDLAKKEDCIEKTKRALRN